MKRYIPDNASAVENLRPENGQPTEYIQDSQLSFLWLAVARSGNHTYIVRTTNFEKKQVRIPVAKAWKRSVYKEGDTVDGLPVVISLKDARKWANIAYNQSKVKPADRKLLKTCLDLYLTDNEDHSAKTSKEYWRLADRFLKPYYEMDVEKDITPAFLDDLKTEMEKAPISRIKKSNPDEYIKLSLAPTRPGIDPTTRYAGKSQTYRTFMLLRGLYSYLISRGEVQVNPLDNFTKNRAGRRKAWLKRPNARSDYIHCTEMRKFYKAGTQIRRGQVTFRALLLELLTGFRGEAVVSLRLDQINHELKAIEIRAGDAGQKGRPALFFPLGDWAWEIVEYQYEQVKHTGTQWLFPSRNTKTKDEHRKPDHRGTLFPILEQTGIKLIGNHDLRRTFATYMRAFATDDYIYNRLVGHSTGQQDDNDTRQVPLNEVYFISEYNMLKAYIDDYDEFMAQAAGVKPVTDGTKALLKRLRLTEQQIAQFGKI